MDLASPIFGRHLRQCLNRSRPARHRAAPIGLFLAGGLCAGFFPPAAQALEPDEIVVLFNTQSPESLMVARYYMNARRIPLNHLIPVTCDASENISELQYRSSFVPQVLKQLSDKQLDSEKPGNTPIKCIVTTTGVPLRIGAQVPSVAERAEIADLQRQLADTLQSLAGEAAAYEHIAPVSASDGAAGHAPISAPSAATAPATNAQPDLKSVVDKLNAAITAVSFRINELPPAERSAAISEFAKVQERVVGIGGLASKLTVPAGSPNADAAQRSLNALKISLAELQDQYNALVPMKDSPHARSEMIQLKAQSDGEVGQAREIQNMLAYLQPANTESCLDNELALLFDKQDYSRGNWLANPKFIGAYHPLSVMAQRPGAQITRTVMVCRLDGLNAPSIEKMIDTTLKVEKAGLDGKIYLDARGLRGTDPYAIFDADIRRAYTWLHDHADMPVVLDDKPDLIKAADSPDCALYCGWYSLRKYQDSAQWLPGAVGYHVASYEMETLHNPTETGWVPNLLKRGFCGTLGATDEPYLDAFPKPSLFIPLLLSGQFTQGEVWQITEPWLSWRIGYVGDPLYNPFKVHPRVKVQDLLDDPVLRYAFDDLGRTPPETAPATSPPPASRQ